MTDMNTRKLSDNNLVKGDSVLLNVGTRNGRPVFLANFNDTDCVVRFIQCADVSKKDNELWKGEVAFVKESGRTFTSRKTKYKVVNVFIGNPVRVEEAKIFFDEKRGLTHEIKSGKRILQSEAIPATKEIHLMKHEDKILSIGIIRVCGQVVMRVDEGTFKSSQTSPFAAKLTPLVPQLTQGMYKKLGKLYSSWKEVAELYKNLRTSKAA